MIKGLANYYDLLCEKIKELNRTDTNYLNISDTIAWCKDIYRAIDKDLENKKDTRNEMIEKRDEAKKRAQMTGDISQWGKCWHFESLIRKYDILQEAVKEQWYL